MAKESKKHERFGRYLILDHLVDGGMAKICRARFLGEQADKVVAIKMVQPQFSQDESFKTMFLDELKVTFGLIHPNIVQTYDYGLYQDQLFVAMEYCDGRNLKEYLEKLKEKRFVFPVEISVYITTQVCQALHYAHTLTDKLTGKKSNIIHRDISPHNIMLTFDGAIKVIDFGIAKAETNTESTQAGTIKGKISYLAPEYLEGYELDPRYDEFAVGITIWELLCNRKLFKAKNELAILKKIQECKIPPPSTINPRVSKELDKIVLKSLSRDRNKRYENLDQLNRALIKHLYSFYPDFNASDLSYFSQELFKAEIKQDREKLFEYGKIDLSPYLNDLNNEKNDGGKDKNLNDSSNALKKESVLDFGFEKEETKKLKIGKKKTDFSIEDNSGEEEDENKKNITKKIRRTELTKRINIGKGERKKKKVRKKRKKGTSTKKKITRPSRINPKIVFLLALLVGSFIYFNFFMGNKGEGVKKENKKVGSKKIKDIFVKNKEKSGKVKEGRLSGKGKVVLSNFDSTQQKVFVDGKEVKVDIFGTFELALMKEVFLRVEEPDLEHFVKKIKLTSGKESIDIKIPKMPILSYGYLLTYENCITGTISFELFGEPRVESLPIDPQLGIAFPLEGENIPTIHKVKYQKKGEKLKKNLDFKINSEDDVIDLCDLIKK